MSSSERKNRVDTAISDVYRLARPEMHGLDMTIITSGEENRVIMIGKRDPWVIKLPYKDKYRRTVFEALIIDAMAQGTHPPLVVPEVIDVNPAYPHRAIYTQGGGITLSHEKARNFDPKEKKELGRRIGEFVAWLPTVISLEGYAEIINDPMVGGLVISDRKYHIMRYGYEVRTYETIPEPLDDVLFLVEEEYHKLNREGKLEPIIVGHDDLRVDNVTFVTENELWLPNSIFDFGLTKPSTPERELRHIVPLGKEAIEAAIKAYEAATGYTIDRSLLRFWAIAQAATAAAYFFIEGDRERFEERFNDLKYLRPDKDWSLFPIPSGRKKEK